jgi:hypothetical protein
MKGQIRLTEDFNAPMNDKELALWYDSPLFPIRRSMKLLIDTHILLWWLTDYAKLLENARQFIATPDYTIFVSHASLWEIQIKAMAGKLTANLRDIIQQLPIHANRFVAWKRLSLYLRLASSDASTSIGFPATFVHKSLNFKRLNQ